MTSRAKSIAYGLLLVLAFAAGWAVNGWRADARVARAESSQSKQAQAQAQKTQAATEKKAAAVVTHAAAQQDNTHDYTQQLAALEAGRAADADRIASLQHSLRATATAHAQAAADAAACRNLAAQHERLAAHLADGAAVVGGLVELVERRDAQVDLLKGQVLTERQLVEQLLGQ